MPVENYRNVVIGSGEGGKYLAWHLAQSGQQTVVVERRWIGGPARMSIVFLARTKRWSNLDQGNYRRGEDITFAKGILESTARLIERSW